MEGRIAELEAGLRAWEGKSRRRTWLLVLLPVVVAAEVRGLRPLPQQLGAEREARTRAEAELAQARGQLASLNGERDGLAAALSTAKGELARAQAERTELEQRLAQLQDAAQAPNAA